MQFDAFEFADALLGAQVDALRVEQFAQHVRDHLAAVRQAERGELHRQPVAVAVHHHAGQVVRFAEADAVARVRRVQLQDVVPEVHSTREPVAEESAVERRGRFPAVQPHVDLRLRVEQPAGDEVAAVRDEIDLVAVGRGALDALDRAGEHPRVSPEERLRALGPENHFGRHDRFRRSGRVFEADASLVAPVSRPVCFACVLRPRSARVASPVWRPVPPEKASGLEDSTRPTSLVARGRCTRVRVRPASASPRLSSIARTRSSSSVLLIGLVMKSSVPASTAASTSLGWSSAVTISTDTPAVAGSARSRRHTSNPLIFGIITSSSMRSGATRAPRRARRLAVVDELRLEPGAVEVGVEQVGVGRVVVGDQNARHGVLFGYLYSILYESASRRAALASGSRLTEHAPQEK